MRIATWNVNSLKARLEKVSLVAGARAARRAADAGDQARRQRRARRRVHAARLRARPPRRGALERRRDRQPRRARRRGHQLRRAAAPRRARPTSATTSRWREARMISAALRRRAGGQHLRAQRALASARRSTRRSSPGSSASRRWLRRDASPRRAAGARRRLQRRARPTPTSGIRGACHGGTHVSPRERDGLRALDALGPGRRLPPAPPGAASRYTWWDYRAGNFHKNFGMRIDHLLVTPPARASASSGPRSIARRARASRSRRTTRRW